MDCSLSNCDCFDGGFLLQFTGSFSVSLSLFPFFRSVQKSQYILATNFVIERLFFAVAQLQFIQILPIESHLISAYSQRINATQREITLSSLLSRRPRTVLLHKVKMNVQGQSQDFEEVCHTRRCCLQHPTTKAHPIQGSTQKNNSHNNATIVLSGHVSTEAGRVQQQRDRQKRRIVAACQK
jgi:hypothetical protein